MGKHSVVRSHASSLNSCGSDDVALIVVFEVKFSFQRIDNHGKRLLCVANTHVFVWLFQKIRFSPGKFPTSVNTLVISLISTPFNFLSSAFNSSSPGSRSPSVHRPFGLLEGEVNLTSCSL
ncbi:hypothetical protein ACFE04_028531 [Oxalis oulophora]